MRRLSVLFALTTMLLVAAPAGATHLEDDLAGVGDQIDQIKDQIRSSRGERTELADRILEIDADLERLVADLEAAEADLAGVQADITSTSTELDVTREELSARYAVLQETRVELASAKERARERAVRIYMGGGQDVDSVIFSADEVTALGVGMRYATEVMASTEKLLNGMQALEVEVGRQADLIGERETDLEVKVAHLVESRDKLDGLRQRVEDSKAQVEEELHAQQDLLKEVLREIEHFEKELDGLEREESRLQALLAEEQNPSEDGGSSSGGSGQFVRPVPGSISSPFGYRIHPILGTSRLHAGVDMRASHGTPIKAAASGRVILARYYGGYGNAVIIDHGGGLSTLYAHQTSLAVSYGSNVGAGQVIGYVGTTGLSTGAHLHFEVRRWGTPIDPAPFL